MHLIDASYTYDRQCRTDTITDGSGTTTFAYDYDGRATSITYPNATSDTFGYNGLGARMSSSGANGSKTFRRAGLGVTSSVLDDGTKKYTPGVSSRENGVSTFQHSGLKNALDQTDSSENVTASRHYDAFGNVISSSGSWQGPFGYAGDFGYQEDGNGLKLLGHRYYDSDTGRFLTRDPIGAGRNWYTYAGNNPISRADPAGLQKRTLTGNQKQQVQDAIDDLRARGYVHVADLQGMLDDGNIYYNSGVDGFALQWRGHIELGKEFFSTIDDLNSTSIKYSDNTEIARVQMGAILAHEYNHITQGWGYRKSHSKKYEERRAYRYEVKYLRTVRDSYDRNSYQWNMLNIWIGKRKGTYRIHYGGDLFGGG